jgi:hypothetical protein
MNLSEVPWSSLWIFDAVRSNLDNVEGYISLLDDNLITIVWKTGSTMKFTHAWTNDITYLGA